MVAPGGRPETSRIELLMKSKTKIWLGVGAFVVAGAGGTAAETPTLRVPPSPSVSDLALTRALASEFFRRQEAPACRTGQEAGRRGR
jgi:hypothetical protein